MKKDTRFYVSDVQNYIININIIIYIYFYFNLNFISAARQTGRCIEYLLMFNDGWPNKIISSEEAKVKWPKLLFKFLEEHIRLYQPIQQTVMLIDFSCVESVDVDGEPQKVCCKFLPFENSY